VRGTSGARWGLRPRGLRPPTSSLIKELPKQPLIEQRETLRYGLCLPNAAPCDPIVVAELAKRAEDAGWDGVFLEDYIGYQGMGIPTFDPWIELASIASATTAIKLGIQVAALPRRRPWKLAGEAVTLDHLSDGRLILGVGLGDVSTDPGFNAVGEPTDVQTRAELLDESLDIIAGLWTAEPFSYEGRHFRVRDLTLLPQPVQKPRIPIWVGWCLAEECRQAASGSLGRHLRIQARDRG
jgi:alkanesulfonate monooxygenase SsuD/methylene tetrahydromethanopterin reductase-like flavin-dependent oxidoreductase (luciferase family)